MSQLVLPPLKHVASPNYSTRKSPIDLIVCHDCEGSYAGSINWFSQERSQVSAHLVLREDGGEVTQMVPFEKKAWHAVAFNSRSIGLEMAGFATKGFADAEWQSAANIVAYLLHRFSIPCRWAAEPSETTVRLPGSMPPGFCSHYDLGKAGGGHRDPTTDSSVWTHFIGLVSEAHRLTPPLDWNGVAAVAPDAPASFVPTPTIRRD
jgi:hypothetical protein